MEHQSDLDNASRGATGEGREASKAVDETVLCKALVLCDLALKLERIPDRLDEAERAYNRSLVEDPSIPFVLASYSSFYIRKKLPELKQNSELRAKILGCLSAVQQNLGELPKDYASEFLNVSAIFYARVEVDLKGRDTTRLNPVLLLAKC